MCRCCPLSCLSLGMQPTLLLFSTDNATQLQLASSSAHGLLPLTAFLAASVHQVLDMCTPTHSIHIRNNGGGGLYTRHPRSPRRYSYNNMMQAGAKTETPFSQQFFTALKLVRTPIVPINCAVPFVAALRLQCAEASSALSCCQRAHIHRLQTSGKRAATALVFAANVSSLTPAAQQQANTATRL